MANFGGATYVTPASADDEISRIPGGADDEDEARLAYRQLTRIGDPNSWQITHVGENHPERSMLSAPAEVVTQRPGETGSYRSGSGASEEAPLQRISAPASKVEPQGTGSSGDAANLQRIPESEQVQAARLDPDAQTQLERIPPKDSGRLQRELAQHSQAQRDINLGTPEARAAALRVQIANPSSPELQALLRVRDMTARAKSDPVVPVKLDPAAQEELERVNPQPFDDPGLKRNTLPEDLQRIFDVTDEEKALRNATAPEPAHGVLGRFKEIGKGYLYGGGIHGMIEGAADPRQLEQDIFMRRDLPRLAARAQIARGQLDDQLKRYDEIGRQTGIYPGTGEPTLAARVGEERMNLLLNKLVLSEQDKQELLRQGNVRLSYLGKRVQDAETNNKVHNILRAAQQAGRQIAPEEREFIRQKTGATLPAQFDPQSQFLKQDESGRWQLLQVPKSRPGAVTVTNTGVKGMSRARLSQENDAMRHYEASKGKYANDPKGLEQLRKEFIRKRGWDPEKR